MDDLPKMPTILGRRWRHRKTQGIYRVIATGLIEETLTPCVVYEAEKGGRVWVRPYDEFMDGRFEQI